jgi:hypothetical protein
MYPLLLGLHNLTRYAIVILAIWLLYNALRNTSDLDGQRKTSLYYTIALDTQFLLGLLLYAFASPLTQTALADFSAAMSNSLVRFFALDHPISMVLAIAMGHIASLTAKKEGMEPRKRNQRVTLFVGLSLVFIVLGHANADMLNRFVPFL